MPVSKRFKSLMTRKGGVKISPPPVAFAGFTQWLGCVLRKWRRRILEQNAQPFIPDASLPQVLTGGPPEAENASKPLSFA
jgi:hypothetical protein